MDGVPYNAQPEVPSDNASANDDPANKNEKDPNSLEDTEATIQENEMLRDVIEDNSEVLESLIVPVYIYIFEHYRCQTRCWRDFCRQRRA